MVAQFRPLSRPQIARIVNNDAEAIRYFEALFRAIGETVPVDLTDLQAAVDLLESFYQQVKP